MDQDHIFAKCARRLIPFIMLLASLMLVGEEQYRKWWLAQCVQCKLLLGQILKNCKLPLAQALAPTTIRLAPKS